MKTLLQKCMYSGRAMKKFCKNCNMDMERYADGRCKVCCLARHAAWARENKEKRNASSLKWNVRNRGKKRALNATYRKANKERIKEKRRAQRQQDPSIERCQSALRRARRRNNGGRLSKDIVQRLLETQKGLCACCGRPLDGVFHLDHIMPLSLGGEDSDSNVQLLLPRCNLQKYNSSPEEFFARRQQEMLHEGEFSGTV